MPATRSATRSGKASLEPAAPHWITSISSSDARRLHLIRWGWHLSQFLPFVLYYAGAVEAPAKFPASISFTQRQGWLIYAIALFWVPAWLAFLDLIRRNASARGVLALMDGRAAPDACALALRRMHARVGGCGGTISLKPSGEVGVCFSTPRMAWACARGEEVRSGIDRAVAECGEKEAPLVEVVSV